jgi:hypothetical protein
VWENTDEHARTSTVKRLQDPVGLETPSNRRESLSEQTVDRNNRMFIVSPKEMRISLVLTPKITKESLQPA